MSHVKWPDIEGFHNVRKAVKAYGDNVGPTSIAHKGAIVYKSKIKLHGTNGAITLKNNGKDVFAQSRSSIIGTGNDNCGFAAWVEKNRDFFEMAPLGEVTTIFGEWCGPGVQKGVAISNIDRKIFAVFAVQVDDKVFVDPIEIANLVRGQNDDVIILPWGDQNTVIVDWTDETSMQKAVDIINPMVDAIDSVDPWVKEVFNVEGNGEGLVWYPISLTDTDGSIDRDALSQYLFKTKGEKHKDKNLRRGAAQLDPEVVAGSAEFAELVLSEARLEQGVTEAAKGEYADRMIGPFLKWVSTDVNKECQDELEASGLTWKEVSKSVMNGARTWYREKIKEI